jgi:CheY-like chemotaxis protein
MSIQAHRSAKNWPLSCETTLSPSKLAWATVLVVDDDEQLRRMVSFALREHGCQILEAANGIEAMLSCRHQSQPIDLVITDVVMPHMSGWDLTARLQRFYPAVKILMMSGFDQVNRTNSGPIIRREDSDRVPGLFYKPFSIVSLSERVRQMLGASA